MKIEIRKINLGAVVFSAYPLALFAFSFINVLFGSAAPNFGPDYTAVQSIMATILQMIVEVAVGLTVTLVVAFIYNVFCSLGIKGLRFELADVDDAPAADDTAGPAANGF